MKRSLLENSPASGEDLIRSGTEERSDHADPFLRGKICSEFEDNKPHVQIVEGKVARKTRRDLPTWAMLAGCWCLKSTPVETGKAGSLRRICTIVSIGGHLLQVADKRWVKAHGVVDDPNVTYVEEAADSSRKLGAILVLDG